ncbi:hypothetical protein SOVF_159280 [Spinacia oleracea]|nr:hypothetical protein SOVF_159280 [Spinacia oleracea]
MLHSCQILQTGRNLYVVRANGMCNFRGSMKCLHDVRACMELLWIDSSDEIVFVKLEIFGQTGGFHVQKLLVFL